MLTLMLDAGGISCQSFDTSGPTIRNYIAF